VGDTCSLVADYEKRKENNVPVRPEIAWKETGHRSHYKTTHLPSKCFGGQIETRYHACCSAVYLILSPSSDPAGKITSPQAQVWAAIVSFNTCADATPRRLNPDRLGNTNPRSLGFRIVSEPRRSVVSLGHEQPSHGYYYTTTLPAHRSPLSGPA